MPAKTYKLWNLFLLQIIFVLILLQIENKNATQEANPQYVMKALPPIYDSQKSFISENNVYFEYPENWGIRRNNLEFGDVVLLPDPESPEGINTKEVIFIFSSDFKFENWKQMLKDLPPSRENTIWDYVIFLNNDFQGFEWLWDWKEKNQSVLEFLLYNEKRQVGVGIFLFFDKDNEILNEIGSPVDVYDVFPNIQRIIESIRVWDE